MTSAPASAGADGDLLDQVAALLDEAGALHHRVYRRTDGADDDWPLWYAEWLVARSELPDLLVVAPTRSALVHLLVQADRDAGSAGRDDEPWQRNYARRIVDAFR